MRSDDEASCGCLPWGRRRAPLPSSTRRSSTASVAAGSSRARSILKSSPEPLPSKWRSQTGTSETSSTEGGSETGNGPAFFISATAFPPGEEPVAPANAGGRGARSSIGTQPRYGSQVQPPRPASGSAANSTQAPKSTDSGLAARPEGTLAAADDQRGSAGTGVGEAPAAAPAPLSEADAAGLADTALRLQGLQERFRQRTGRSGAAAFGAVAATAASDDQMQCDSFTYHASMYGGRRSSNGGRLGPLPPLPASPVRPTGGPGAAGPSSGGGGGLGVHGLAPGHGPVRHGPAILDQGGLMVDKRPKVVQGTRSPDLSPAQSIVMTHIPGSLPSVTQPQASPGLMRIHPLAPAWGDAQAPQALAPSAAAASAAAAPPPKQPRLSWSDRQAMQAEARGGATAAAATAAAAAAAATQGRSSNTRGPRVRFLPQEETEHEEATSSPFDSPARGNTPSRFAVSGDGSPAGTRPGGVPATMRHSNTGSHHMTHRPAGYSSAAAPVLPLGVRQLARMTSGGAASSRGMERPSSALSSMTVEAFAAGDDVDESTADVTSPSFAAAQAREGTGTDHLVASPPAQHGGGRYSLPLYDSIAPGAVLAKPPSFSPAAGEPRSTPGCIEPRVEPPQLDVQAPAVKAQASQQRLSLQLPTHQLQHQLSQQPSQLQHLRAGPSQQRLQPSHLLEEEPKSAPVEPLPKRAFVEGPASLGAIVAGGGGGAGGTSEGGGVAQDLRPAARLAQQRMAAARQNEEMLAALLASSRRALDVGALLAEPAGSAAAELERMGRVQDAVSRLEGIRAAPAPAPAVAPPAPAAAASSRTLNSRSGSNENAITDFAGTQPPAPNSTLGVKPW